MFLSIFVKKTDPLTWSFQDLGPLEDPKKAKNFFFELCQNENFFYRNVYFVTRNSFCFDTIPKKRKEKNFSR